MANSCAARFWFATGVEVFPGIDVPSPPPRSYRFAVREPMPVIEDRDFLASDCIAPQTAEFTLVDWKRGSEVAHYELLAAPPRGWRWLAVNNAIRAERVR